MLVRCARCGSSPGEEHRVACARAEWVPCRCSHCSIRVCADPTLCVGVATCFLPSSGASAPLLLCFSDPPVLRAAAQTCVPMWDISLAVQSRPRVSPWTSCSSCCSAAGPAGGSAPRGATYSTAQEQHTGFSSRCDDAHVFYVYMSESVQKESGRPSPKALARPVPGLRPGPY